ncbi:MAG TPA: S8/S53 family peptidase, partial [Thermoleophilaceae bacterium]
MRRPSAADLVDLVPAIRVLSRPVAGVAAIAALALAGCGDGSTPLRDSVAFDGRSPRVPAAARVRVLVELRRPSLGDRMATEQLDPAAQRAHVASLASEAEALLSALRAKDVETRRPVLYGRAWSGFAVTLSTNDLPAVQALGLRSEPVRRFYGATSAVTPAAGAVRVQRRARGRAAPTVALLDSGVSPRARPLRERVVAGYDAVDRDRDPAPRGSRERHGTAMASVLAAELPAGERFASIRVAGRQRDTEGGPELEVGTTDQVLAGLERTVDPDGDGDVEDRIPIALVGVSSPYSGFANSPEDESARAAAAIGTLVIAPAGNEGAATGSYGTIGSPAAAPHALAVGALDGAAPGGAAAPGGGAGGGAAGGGS